MMTMLCLKAECTKTGKSIEQIFTENKGLFISSEQMLIQAEERAYRREMTEKIKRLFGKVSPRPKFKKLVGQKFEIDGKLFKDVDTTFELVKKIYEYGGSVYEHLTTSGTVIFLDEVSDQMKTKIEKRGLKCICIEDFYEILSNTTTRANKS